MKTKTAFRLAVMMTFVLLILSVVSSAWGQVNVLTRNYNNQRTGADLSETILSSSNVNSSQFGKLFMLPVDDQVFAGILYVSNASIAGGSHNVIYVATANNTVYAFDADTFGPPLWQRNFNGTGRPTRNSEVGQACGSYRDFLGNGSFGSLANIGIVGTPVIDGTTNTMYFVTRTVEGTATVQRLRAIDTATGADRLPPQVIDQSITFPGTGEGGNGTVVSFNPVTANQRPGLALAQGMVYIGWSSYCDTHPYHGWMMSFDAGTLARIGVYNTSPNGGGSSVWMSGAAPVVDTAGSVYVTTGNGSNNGTTDFSESILKLAPRTLALADFFTATNFNSLDSTDLDFNSSGPVMLPGTNFVTTGAKEGKLYVVNSNNLGHVAPGDTQIQQVFQAVDPTVRGTGTHHIHNASPVWPSPQGLNVYVWGENDFLHAYRFDSGTQKFLLPAFGNGAVLAPPGMPGGHMVVSANGSQPGTGVLWASIPRNGDANQMTVAGHLFAFNAETLQLLWSSTGPGDDTLNFAKGSPPVVANGKVYLASQSNFVSVYGLKSAGQITLNLALNRPATGSAPCNPASTPDKAFNGSAEGGPADKWCSSVANPFLQADLGANFSLNRFVLEFAGAGGEDLGNNIRDYMIQVSTDGTNFETVANVTGNLFSIATHDVSGVIGRFVRLVVLSPTSTTNPASVYEFQVYGSAAPSTPDFLVSASPNFQTLTVGDVANYTATITPINGFVGSVALSVSGLPAGATGSFAPASINGSGSSTLTINTATATAFGSFPLTITAVSGAATHTTVAFFTLNRNAAGSVQVSAPAQFNVPGIKTDGTTFNDGGADFGGSAYSANLLGPSQTFEGITFSFGPPDVLDAWNQPAILPLPAGRFATLGMLATSVDGNSPNSVFTVTYTDGTTDALLQSVSDWFTPQNYAGEVIAVAMPYRNSSDGTKDNRPFNLYAYFLPLNPAKTVSSIAIGGPLVEIYAMTLLPSHSTAPDFALSALPSSLSVTPESTATSTITVTPLNGFNSTVRLSLSGVPSGVTAFLRREETTDTSTLEVLAHRSAHVGRFVLTITGSARSDQDGGPGDFHGTLTHTTNVTLDVRAEAASPIQVDLSSQFLKTGIYTDGSMFSSSGGFDSAGAAYSANHIGSSTITFDGTLFQLGPPNAPDVVPSANQTVPLPTGKFASLQMLAAAVNGDQSPGFSTPLNVNYSDGTLDSFAQGVSDWFDSAAQFPGESIAKDAGPRNFSGGTQGHHHVNIYGYLFALNNSKTVTGVTLPNDNNIGVLALTLVPQACIYALDQSAANAMTFNGPFDVNADCGVVVNSSSTSALNLTGTGRLTAENVQVVGGIVQSPGVTISPAPSVGTLVQPDPFRFLKPPAPSTSCDHTNLMVHGEEATLSPGTYCNGITVMSGKEGAQVNFRPGTYVLMGGGLNVKGPAMLVGTGVTFFLTQGLGFNYGPVSIDKLVVSRLKSPTNGPMEGILFFQDPAIGTGPGSAVSGSSASRIEGVLYFPTTALSYSVAGQGGDFLVLVGDTVAITGPVVLNNDFSDLSHGSPVHHR